VSLNTSKYQIGFFKDTKSRALMKKAKKVEKKMAGFRRIQNFSDCLTFSGSTFLESRKV